MTDILFMEEMLKLCNSTVKPRLIHKKGVGAYGQFRPYMSLADYTTADFLCDTEKVTPVFVRFSKTFGKDGSADSARDTSGFATKFYTQEGSWDLICHNMPAYYTNDGEKFPQLLGAMGPAKDTNITDIKGFWSFAAENPEAIHMALWLFSDRGTIKSFCNMEGYSINTMLWKSEAGKECFVRLKWEPMAGVRCISRQEAEFLAGFDPDIAIGELQNSIAKGEYPAYELSAQILPVAEKDTLGFEPKDQVLVWPEELVPYIKIGKMVLDSLPKDYQGEVEKTVFSPASRISGIKPCDSSLLEAMMMLYSGELAGRGGIC